MYDTFLKKRLSKIMHLKAILIHIDRNYLTIIPFFLDKLKKKCFSLITYNNQIKEFQSLIALGSFLLSITSLFLAQNFE